MLTLLGGQVAINLVFSNLYYYPSLLKFSTGDSTPGSIECVYFSFITALTIGYGDTLPATDWAKLFVITQGMLSAIYFAFVVAVMTAKLFFPGNTMVFSRKICFDPSEDRFFVRILNTHKEKLLNPEIRVHVTRHAVGNVIAASHAIEKYDEQPYLGRHDFIHQFSSVRVYGTEHEIDLGEMWKAAHVYDSASTNDSKSRFKISISISGSYGLQQAAFVKDYYPLDVSIGRGFKACEYNELDQREGNMRYSDFPNFWKDFDTILPVAPVQCHNEPADTPHQSAMEAGQRNPDVDSFPSRTNP